MKRNYLLFFSLLFLSAISKAQYVTIPDANFRAYLQQQYPSSFNSSGMMDTTSSAIVNADSLTCNGQNISNLQGIQYFKSLITLQCASNQLTNLPALSNSLKYLTCSDNQLTTLSTLPNSLSTLYCSNNKLTNITLPNSLSTLYCPNNQLTNITLPNSLTTLYCPSNQLTNIIAFPNSLTYIMCSSNQLTQLPALPLSLTSLDCSYNQLTQLPAFPNVLNTLTCSYNKLIVLPALPASLQYLYCDNNQLVDLPILSNSLIGLSCNDNLLTSLPSLPNALQTLNCAYNQLVSLPALPNLLSGEFDCYNNKLTSLPALPKNINTLYCSDNQLTDLPALPDSLRTLYCINNNLYCLPRLPRRFSSLDFDTAKIKCLPNVTNAFLYDDVNRVSSYPICNATNNINQCQGYPTISGYIYYDNNKNGIKDGNDFYKPYISVMLSDSVFAFTNSNGYYQISAVDGLGSYALVVDPPAHYAAVPVIPTYTFTSFDTSIIQNIALQPISFFDSLYIYLYSFQYFPKPGSLVPITVFYANVGTTTLSPTITFNYDNTLLTYDSSSDHNVVNNGSSLSLSETNLVPGQNPTFTAYFTVKPTDVIGDSVKTKVTISANAFSTSDSSVNLISSSFDPNEKDATPQLTPQQVASGKSINYTIRFQNTGNDTAFNIVIADTLSSLLQDSTLQMISSSNPCKVTVTGNVVYFEFLNVLLPDSGVNQLGSNGYVSFSVQPQTSVSSGSISNTASIYFDYNSPVVTNTATTLIQDPNVVVPVRLLSFNALTQANTNNVLLYWSTTSEINTKAFIVEQSTDGINFSGIATVTAKGFGSNSYSYTATQNSAVVYYRLKLIDNNGQYTYSKIIAITNAQLESFVVITNPAKDMISIKTNAPSLNNTTAKIINSEGAVVKNFILQQGLQTIDVSALANGFYYIKTGLVTRKIVISR